jgi:hypothetical protein
MVAARYLPKILESGPSTGRDGYQSECSRLKQIGNILDRQGSQRDLGTALRSLADRRPYLPRYPWPSTGGIWGANCLYTVEAIDGGIWGRVLAGRTYST